MCSKLERSSFVPFTFKWSTTNGIRAFGQRSLPSAIAARRPRRASPWACKVSRVKSRHNQHYDELHQPIGLNYPISMASYLQRNSPDEVCFAPAPTLPHLRPTPPGFTPGLTFWSSGVGRSLRSRHTAEVVLFEPDERGLCDCAAGFQVDMGLACVEGREGSQTRNVAVSNNANIVASTEAVQQLWRVEQLSWRTRGLLLYSFPYYSLMRGDRSISYEASLKQN